MAGLFARMQRGVNGQSPGSGWNRPQPSVFGGIEPRALLQDEPRQILIACKLVDAGMHIGGVDRDGLAFVIVG